MPNWLTATFVRVEQIHQRHVAPRATLRHLALEHLHAAAQQDERARYGKPEYRHASPRGKIVPDGVVVDAVAVVTGCRLGKRALKFRDWGKMAATFVDVSTGKAIRVAARESSKALARQMHPEIENKNGQQMAAYREMSDDDLFATQWVKVDLPPEEFPGYKGERIVCESCGEGINFRREVRRDGKVLCRSCAGENYYTSAS